MKDTESVRLAVEILEGRDVPAWMYTWTGGDGNWSDSSHWMTSNPVPGAVPGNDADDRVELTSSGIVTLNYTPTNRIEDISTLSGASMLRLHGDITLTTRRIALGVNQFVSFSDDPTGGASKLVIDGADYYSSSWVAGGFSASIPDQGDSVHIKSGTVVASGNNPRTAHVPITLGNNSGAGATLQFTSLAAGTVYFGSSSGLFVDNTGHVLLQTGSGSTLEFVWNPAGGQGTTWIEGEVEMTGAGTVNFSGPIDVSTSTGHLKLDSGTFGVSTSGGTTYSRLSDSGKIDMLPGATLNVGGTAGLRQEGGTLSVLVKNFVVGGAATINGNFESKAGDIRFDTSRAETSNIALYLNVNGDLSLSADSNLYMATDGLADAQGYSANDYLDVSGKLTLNGVDLHLAEFDTWAQGSKRNMFEAGDLDLATMSAYYGWTGVENLSDYFNLTFIDGTPDVFQITRL